MCPSLVSGEVKMEPKEWSGHPEGGCINKARGDCAEEKGLSGKVSSSESFNFSRIHPRTPWGGSPEEGWRGSSGACSFMGIRYLAASRTGPCLGDKLLSLRVIKSLLWAPRGTNFAVCRPKGPSNYGWKSSLLAQSYCLSPCSRTAGCKTWALRVTTLVPRGLWALAQTGPRVSRALWGEISAHTSKTSKEG